MTINHETTQVELNQRQEAERIKRLPYLFRGLSISKLKYSLEHEDGTPRPETKRFFGQWSESLAQACSYAISPQHEEDRSFENTRQPGVVLVSLKEKIGDFSSWTPDKHGQRNQSYFREYDSNRNPKLSDGQWLFIAQESLANIDQDSLKEQGLVIATYSSEDVIWFENNLGMGTFFLMSEIKKQMLQADGEFAPPLSEMLDPEDNAFVTVEFALFEAIKDYPREEIKLAHEKYQRIAAVAFGDADQADRAEIKKKAEQVLAKFEQVPYFSIIEELVGIAYFLSKK